MSVTFMVGNGFDLNCGLATRYIDTYKEYLSSPSSNALIERFKDIISDSIETWGDFECAIGQYADSFDSEADYIACIRDYSRFLTDYLLKQQSAFLLSDDERARCASQVRLSLNNFYRGTTNTAANRIESIIRSNSSSGYNYICYNYTTTMESILYTPKRGNGVKDDRVFLNVIHIHGLLSQGIVLGVDNINQILTNKFILSPRGERACIKPTLNMQYDDSRVAEASKIIKESSVICVFGLSLGPSDNIWRIALVNWLKSSKDHHLVIFDYKYTSLSGLDLSEKMDVEEDAVVETLHSWAGADFDSAAYYTQVHIPVGYRIFNFGKIHLQGERPSLAKIGTDTVPA